MAFISGANSYFLSDWVSLDYTVPGVSPAGTVYINSVSPKISYTLLNTYSVVSIGTISNQSTVPTSGTQATIPNVSVLPIISSDVIGNASTFSNSSLTNSSTGTLSGNTATSSVGTEPTNTTIPLVYNIGSFAIGTAYPVSSKSVTNSIANSLTGNVGLNVTVGLTGLSSSGLVSSPIANPNILPNDSSSVGQTGILGSIRTTDLTGNSIQFSTGDITNFVSGANNNPA